MSRGRITRRRATRVLAAFAMTAGLVGVAPNPTEALTGTNFDATDGNLVVNGSERDWESFLPEPDDDNTFVFTDAASGSSDSSLAGGTKDNTECPTPSTGSIPNNKDDLLRFYLSHETVEVSGDDHTILYLGYVRALPGTTTASAHGVFELNQSETKCASIPAKGNRPPTASPFFVRTPGDVRLLFDDSGGSAPVVSYQVWEEPCSGGGAGCWTAKVPLSSSVAEGSHNEGSVLDPMPTPDVTISAQQFAEVAIDMTAAELLDPDDCIGFGAAGLFTGSSGNSDQEQSKDFIAPGEINLQNCAPATVKVEKTFTHAPTSDAVFDLYYDGDGDGIADPPGDDDELIDSCTIAFGTVEDTDDPPDGVLDGTCTFDTLEFGDEPFEGLGPHDMVVIESTVPDGFNGSAPQSFSFTFGPEAQTITVTFTNSPAPVDVDFKKVDDDDPGNPLEGAVFTLYDDDDADGAWDDAEGSGDTDVDTSTGRTCTTDAAGDCHEDDDADKPAFEALEVGEFYCVVETTTPTGHDTADPVCFEVELGDGTQSLDLGDIVNPRQHRVIVLVCHEGTLTLHPSSVTLEGATDATDVSENSLAPGTLTDEQQEDLCSIPDAQFPNIPGHGSHTLTVDLADPGHPATP